MAILSNIFVATPSEAAAYSPRSGGSYSCIELKGLTNLEFGTLWAIIQATEFDFDAHDLKEINNDGSTWLFEFPSQLVSELAALSASAITTAAQQWAESEELQWPANEAQVVITELAQQAKITQDQNKGLYLWGSL